ncbi:hypothetical protein [Mucilaginibacter galii]|nr:hypothetical protein [Mucilaginibacter galii]
MKQKLYCCLSFALIITSCHEGAGTSNQTIVKTDSTEVVSPNPDSSKSAKVDIMAGRNDVMTTEQLLSLIRRHKDDIEAKLPTLSKTEANDLYDSYLKTNEALVAKVMLSELNLLDKFYNEDAVNQTRVKKLGNLLAKYDLEYDEIGEGIVEIKTKSDFYDNIFKNYVSDDYKAYLAIKKEEDKVPYSADAGLLISFKEIGERVIVWEKLLAQYPSSKLIDKIKQQYQSYQSDYLFGLDNTSTIEFQNSEKAYINPENIEEFNQFMQKYPSSPTNRLIKILLKNFKDENIRNLIDSEQQKL